MKPTNVGQKLLRPLFQESIMHNQTELHPYSPIKIVTKVFPHPLAEVGTALRLGGVDYFLIGVRDISDGKTEHVLQKRD